MQDPAGLQTWLQYHAHTALSAKEQIDAKLNAQKAEEENRHNQQMEARQPAGSDSTRFGADYLQSKGLPDTATNRQTAFAAFTKMTKTDPGVARINVLGTFGQEVADSNNPGQTIIVPRNQTGMAGKNSASVTAPRKVEEAFTSGDYTEHYLEDHVLAAHARGSSGTRTVCDISKAIGMSETRVTNCLHRLRRQKKVKQHGQNWFLP